MFPRERGVLTAGEDERTRVLVHREVVQLQLAFCVYRQPEKKPTEFVRHFNFYQNNIHHETKSREYLYLFTLSGITVNISFVFDFFKNVTIRTTYHISAADLSLV